MAVIPMVPKYISEEQWSLYRRIINDCDAAGVRVAIGGGFAIGVYTGRWRESKDIDLYVVPRDREAVQQIFAKAGLNDYYDQLPYDRAWIYRSVQGKIIVDAIWAMANHKFCVDEHWIVGGPVVTVGNLDIHIVPPEEIIWAKLYVLQRDRCDWPDILNVIDAQLENLDWRHLVNRLGEDAPLLNAVLAVYRWLSPLKAKALPSWIWNEPEEASDQTGHRRDLLDRREWFGAVLSVGR